MEDCLIYGNFGSVEFSGNIQGDGGHFGPQISSESANMVMKPIFATTKKVTLVTVCKWVSPQYTIYSFADSTREACTVYSETRSRSNVSKEHTHTEGHKYIKTHFLLQMFSLFVRMTLF